MGNGINNVKIIVIGISEDSSNNGNWISGHSISVIVDPYPYNTWTNWDAKQRDLFFLDENGDYITNFNISDWDYDTVYSQIVNLLPE